MREKSNELCRSFAVAKHDFFLGQVAKKERETSQQETNRKVKPFVFCLQFANKVFEKFCSVRKWKLKLKLR